MVDPIKEPLLPRKEAMSDDKKQQFEESVVDLESTSSEDTHVFQDPLKLKYYTKLYEDNDYECRHLLDPELTWTPQEERKITWINDINVCLFTFICFTALNLDRYNLKQALADDFLDDLNLTTNDYNIGSTINLVCFLLAELPLQLISKKLGPEIWIPIQMVAWSIVSICQASLTGKAGFFITRGLLGAWQGGFIADVCLWMSYFYTGPELPMRMGFFYILIPFTLVVSLLLSLGLLEIKTSLIGYGWQWLFIIEGLITLLIGIWAFFQMVPLVVASKTWFRPKGWYTERQERILVNKILRDDPSKGLMNCHTPVSFIELLRAFKDFDLALIYCIRLLDDIGTKPADQYITLILRQMGFSTAATNALTIPKAVGGVITMMAVCWYSEKWNQRALVLLFQPLWVIITLIPMVVWDGFMVKQWATYALLVVLLIHPTSTAVSITWCSANLNLVRNRTVSAAVVNIFSQAAGIISSNIYRMDDAPLYKRGNKQLIAIAAAAFVLICITRTWFQWRNHRRDKIWNAMTKEEQDDYMHNTTDLGNKRLDFRFVY